MKKSGRFVNYSAKETFSLSRLYSETIMPPCSQNLDFALALGT